jgi:protein TonB
MLRRLSTLTIALAVSLGTHGVLLAWRAGSPDSFNRVFQDTPLEVVLVNTRSNEKPTKANVLAQANLAGGGEEERGRATSPLPPERMPMNGDAEQDVFKQKAALELEQAQLLSQQRRDLALTAPPDRKRATGDSTERDRIERNRIQLQQFAEIEKRINEQSARPRKKFVSPQTQEVAYATHYDGMRRRIEDRGTRNFPEERGRKLYGELIMNIYVDLRGNVVETEILKSSGAANLDKRAVAIVIAAAPFGNFTREMRKDAEVLIMTTKFKFGTGDNLETTLMSNP